MCNEISVCYAHEGETGTGECTSVYFKKNWKMVPYHASTMDQNPWHWITVQCIWATGCKPGFPCWYTCTTVVKITRMKWPGLANGVILSVCRSFVCVSTHCCWCALIIIYAEGFFMCWSGYLYRSISRPSFLHFSQWGSVVCFDMWICFVTVLNFYVTV